MVGEADMSMTGQAYDLNDGSFNRYKDDHKLAVKFFFQPVQDAEATLKEGRPIFKDEEFVTIMVPGDRSSIIVRTAHAEDKARFNTQYQKWKAGQEQASIGTPLEKWPMVTRAQVEELKYFGVHTVEQLADVADVHAQKFMGISMLRQRARDYVEASKGEAPLAEMRAQLEEKDNEVETLKNAISDMAKRLEALEA